MRQPDDAQGIKAGWVWSVEGGLVALAMGKGAVPEAPPLTADQHAAALATIAAKFLAVGTPRSLGLVGAGERAALLVAAQATYAAPRELRVYEEDGARAAALAASLATPALATRAVPLPVACAADIVVVAAPVALERAWIRAGTLVTVLAPGAQLAPALLAAAQVYVVGDRPPPPGLRVHATLAAVAAGLVDGRTLDEITILLP